MTTNKTFELPVTEAQMEYLAKQVDADIFALKNYVASAVEHPDRWEGAHSAPELVKKLRAAEALHLHIRRTLRAARGE